MMKSSVYGHKFNVGANAEEAEAVLKKFFSESTYRKKKCEKENVNRYRKLVINGFYYIEYKLEDGVLYLDFYMKSRTSTYNMSCEQVVSISIMDYERYLNPLFRKLADISEQSTYGDMVKECERCIEAGEPVPYGLEYKIYGRVPKDRVIPQKVKEIMTICAFILSIAGLIMYFNGIYMSVLVLIFDVVATLYGIDTKYQPIAFSSSIMSFVMAIMVVMQLS